MLGRALSRYLLMRTAEVLVPDEIQRLSVVESVLVGDLTGFYLLHGRDCAGPAAACSARLEPSVFHQLRDLLPARFHRLTIK